MKVKYVKIILVALLSVLTVILFYFYVSSEVKENPAVNSEDINKGKTADMIRSDMDSILFSFGIRKDWIKEIIIKEKDPKKSSGEVIFSKEVKIPADLPSVDLNYEFTNYFRSNNFEVKVTEDPRTKNITMNMVSLKDTLHAKTGMLKFIYSDTISRNASDIAIVLDSLDLYSLNDVEKILSSVQEFSVILPMRNDKADYQSKIMEMNRDYLLRLSVGNEDNIEADFKEGMKESQRLSRIKSLSLGFQNSSGVLLISRTDNQEFFNTVKNDFIRNNIKVYSDSEFHGFRIRDSKVISLFENIVSESKGGGKKLFYDVNFSPEDFESYDRQLYNMKKLGYRFYSFKGLMDKIRQ